MRDGEEAAVDFDSGREPDSVDRIVVHYLDRLNCGERIDRFHILAEHPETGSEIIDRLEAFVDLDEGHDTQPLRTLGDYTLSPDRTRRDGRRL